MQRFELPVTPRHVSNLGEVMNLSVMHDRLLKMAVRVRLTSAGLEEQARVPNGGYSGGNISNSPMHMGDLGSGVYSQQLSSTLLENEEYILDEVNEALARFAQGTYGICEHCKETIANNRLEALPYTRHCMPCAVELKDGVAVNMNIGRPQRLTGPFAPSNGAPADGFVHDLLPDHSRNGHVVTDSHAAGTPGGGSAVGGLAGSTMGNGEPTADMDAAFGSGQFDAHLDTDAVNLSSYASHSFGSLEEVPTAKPSRHGKHPNSDVRPTR